MKRFLAALLCLSLLLSCLPVMATAQEKEATTNETLVSAQEITTASRMEDAELPQKEAAALYAADALVSVIVELEDAPVLSGFETMNTTELTVGQQVSAYLTRSATLERQAALEKTQRDMIAVLSSTIGFRANVTAQWTGIINAVAVQMPYGKLAEVRALEGVKRAYVETVYDRPEETQSEGGISGKYGYSYNMTDLEAVWNQGYTGQGTLVAVLDSGLDITYASWGNASGMSTGVRRVHAAFTDTSFLHDPADEEKGWELRYTDETLRTFLQTTQLRATTGIEGGKIVYDNNALHKTLKVPFAYDYADVDVNVLPANSDHGTHVSGTIAGYAESGEGEVLFSGVAPDAQILFMKVFSDEASGAAESVIINALEDALLLGADVINLSLGSDNGFAEDDTAANDVYQRLSDAGIVFMVSAGNSGDSAYMNNYGDRSLAADPEISMMSAPAIYENNLAVASINNTITTKTVLTWTDAEGTEHTVTFQDTTDGAMQFKLAGQPTKVIAVDGYGTYSDYYNAGFRSYYGYGGDQGVSGIALVKRGGGLSFTEKVNTATQFVWNYYDSSTHTYISDMPVRAVIVYDEDAESTELIYMSVENAGVTSCFISGVDGHALAEAAKKGEVHITVQSEDVIVEAEDGGQMSSFSSWGAGPALELKPEITAPGGNIWSAVIDYSYSPSDYSGVFDDYEGAYAMMSGTSMAAPHMSGIALLVEQAVRTQYDLSSKTAVAELTEHLLVSTALPQKDANGVYYSPRYQGAGLVNAAAAVSSPAYVSVDGQNVGKLELLDDPERSGVYELVFHVNNISESDMTYNVAATILRPSTEAYASLWGEKEVMCTTETVLQELELGTVTVPAGQTATVSKTVTLTAEEKAELDALFPNGTYVEGFIILTDAAGAAPQIGLPMLAFYGDWTSAPIFDRNLWYDTPVDGENVMNNESAWSTTYIGMASLAGYINLGQNAFDPYFGDQMVYHTENFAISPNGDGYLDTINDFVLYQLREAKLVVVEVTDAETGELYYRDFTTYQNKSLYYSAYGYAIPASQFHFTETSWSGTDLAGNVLPSGTQCTMTITAYGEGDYGEEVYDAASGMLVTDFERVVKGETTPTFNGHEMDLSGNVISFPVTVDTVAPKLENNTVSIYEQDGRVYMTGTVYDLDGAIASVEIHPYVSRTYKEGYGDPTYIDYDLDKNNPFYSNHVYDAATKTLTFTADVTEYVHANESYPGENNYYEYTWTGSVFISCGDYGLNDRTYMITVNQGEGIILSQTSALLYVGGGLNLSVIDNTGEAGDLLRESSNPEVATIDEFGYVEALAPGQTTITVSKGGRSAVCIVAVRERNTEVIDFKLSLESFSGLKPNGTVMVKVTDLEPANVELYQKHWIISEDAPDMYAGLINVAQYDTTGLSGEIFLNYSATGDSEIQVPGASATLEVTLNGVTRSMTIDWEDLYTANDDEDLVSAASFNHQTTYVTQGETATLLAMYNDSSAHNVCDVALMTAVGASNYSSNNPTDPAEGLVLDGPDFAPTNSTWTGRLVNTEGYALPESIRIFTRYDYGTYYYENEMLNYSYYSYYSYDSTTGEITVYSTPYSNTNDLIIRADGVESPGTPAGERSGETYERPDGIYGPFDWEIVSGSGALTTAENVTVGYETQNLAYYEPAEPGVSVIKATSRDGKYSVNFAVISEPVLPEELALESRRLTLSVGDTATVVATLSPAPSLEQHGEITWESYNPTVASVDPETGLITANAAGYAYLRAYVNVQTGLETYCIVEVLPCTHEATTEVRVEPTCTEDGSLTVTCDKCGEICRHEVLPAGHSYESATTLPTCTEGGYTTHTCTVCGDSYVDSEVEALGHSFEHFVVDPDCDGEGYTQHVCTACGYTYRDEMLPACGHDYHALVTEPTCTEAGYTTYTCAICGDAYVDDFVPVLICAAEKFDDVDGEDWYHESLDYVLNTGLMLGVSNSLFDPNGETTRAQVVTVLYRLAGSPAVEGQCPFADVAEGSYYHDAVVWAHAAGIAQGMSETSFAPDLNITREQLVTFLYRYAAPETEADTAVLEQFADHETVSAYAAAAFVWAVEQGLITGIPGAEDTLLLEPKGPATRVQLATVLMRLEQLEK